jgi:hypothetical protein
MELITELNWLLDENRKATTLERSRGCSSDLLLPAGSDESKT